MISREAGKPSHVRTGYLVHIISEHYFFRVWLQNENFTKKANTIKVEHIILQFKCSNMLAFFIISKSDRHAGVYLCNFLYKTLKLPCWHILVCKTL